MDRKEYYKSLGLSRDFKGKDKEEIANLFKQPKRDKRSNAAHQVSYTPFYEQQMDLLTLPDDNGFKYALVVVDINTGITDAEALKNKDADTVAKALDTIYKRKIIKKLPRIARTDSGSEFKSKVKDWFKTREVLQSVATPGRHRQLAFVERRNHTIGSALFMRMIAQEILTGEISKEWTDNLPTVIEYINKNVKQQQKPKSDMPIQNKDNLKLIPIGTKVRTQLDNPIDVVTNKKLHGKFRATDIKWDPNIKTITNILIMPNQPPLYKVDNIRIGYTRNQLQVVPKDELKPIGEVVIRGNPSSYIPEKILSEKNIKGKLYYFVKWAGFDQPTYSLASDMNKDQPKLVASYRKTK
jgi:transposase InsO family protein